MNRKMVFNKVISGSLSLTGEQAKIIIRALEQERQQEIIGIATDKKERIYEINCIINDLKDIFSL